MAFDSEVGRRIEMTRKAMGISGRDLAKSMAISPASLYWYESGRSSCPALVVSRIAAVLGVSVAALVPRLSADCAPRSAGRACGVRGR